METKWTGFAALLFGVLLLATCVPKVVHADQDVCTKAQESALQKINNAFNPKIDLLLKISKTLQDRGLDPHRHPIIMPNGSVEPADLVETITKLYSQKASAVQQIEAATHDCTNNPAGPEKIINLADFFSGAGLSAVLPQQLAHIDASRLLSGQPFGGTNALVPKVRDDILKGLGIGGDGGDVAKIIRESGCPGCASADSALSALDAALTKLVAGNIAFNNPEHMQVGKPRIVEVKLSTTLPVADLKAQLTEAGIKESASLSVGDRMSATLNGGAAFDISPSGAMRETG